MSQKNKAMTFDLLSDEAKILFVIGEPLRADKSLLARDWHRRAFIDFVEATGLSWEHYVEAFSEVSDWFFSLKKGKRRK